MGGGGREELGGLAPVPLPAAGWVMPEHLPSSAGPVLTLWPGTSPPLQGFYGVYDELFQRLAKQEAEAHERRADRKGKRPPGPFPRFGGWLVGRGGCRLLAEGC